MVIAEQRDGAIRKVTWEALSEGRRLADRLGVELLALLVGHGIKEKAGELAQYGADRVFVADDERLGAYRTVPYAKVSETAIKQASPGTVLLGASSYGKDLAPRVAARLGVGLLSDCIGFDLDGDVLIARRPMYAGKLYAYVSCREGQPQMATMRPNVFEKSDPDTSKSADVVDLEVALDDSDFNTEVVEVLQDTSGRPDLTEAETIVSGGRGMKGPENYAMLEELADLLGATVGASRAAVDAGWRPQSDQVGQTGKVVTPNLYIACGISGAIQHLAGMGTSKVIVAINKDADAPIFQKADFGVVDDLFKVIPPFTEEVRKLKAEG
jgi:electron transfer flavoprotein alpha subunit